MTSHIRYIVSRQQTILYPDMSKVTNSPVCSPEYVTTDVTTTLNSTNSTTNTNSDEARNSNLSLFFRRDDTNLHDSAYVAIYMNAYEQ